MDEPILKIECTPSADSELPLVTVRDGTDIIAAEGVDMKDKNARKDFAKSVSEQCPGINADEVEQKLTQLAAETAGPGGAVSVNWPEPLAEEAFYGLAGDVVRLIEPESEADPAALLANFLTAFGNAAGLNSYFVVESDRHYPRLFCALVGETSKGRKGTSWGHIKTLLEAADPEWVKRQVHGLSSGEGLIWSVHDPITKSEPIRDNKKLVTGYQEVITDPGIDDKRAFVLEGELASTLKVMSREGNTLSPVLRNAWDNGTLQALTKNSPAKATGAHISLVGHITKLELLRQLNETEAANGFGNRFLWICVRRSKCLPEGGNLKPEELERLSERVHEALQFAKREQKLWLTNDALEVWREVYPTLSEGQPGLLGAVTSRAESQVLRIALIYALLDKSPDITRDHLYAGLAVWDYAFSSAEYIFGKNIGNPIADKILRLLGNSPDGMTKTELSNAFKHNVNANLLNSAFSSLEQEKRIVTTRTDTGGAPSTRYFITGASTN